MARALWLFDGRLEPEGAERSQSGGGGGEVCAWLIGWRLIRRKRERTCFAWVSGVAGFVSSWALEGWRRERNRLKGDGYTQMFDVIRCAGARGDPRSWSGFPGVLLRDTAGVVGGKRKRCAIVFAWPMRPHLSCRRPEAPASQRWLGAGA
ncbi:hypothetical protein MPNT_10169 [Candidatus Methylacidithermus pantelleriae]|uniref:Uncharacterized protein n=1 Tax=Candidatus Methylacidithermus pantelleriae TaxID=2744239 RepID=A0A8J2BIJ2_9BACT|nr:hypothetical protein MPNT_10169 [Candidatus Methylacidithermus pantelleriae]